ncbi:MAG TPA: VOC family protein [Acidimicrobiales bacterium]|nr:VOC family protein [Acidimicrobiales bacterium]
MAEFTEYAAGTPSWVDIGVHDIDAAVAFYGTLFGWTVAKAAPDSGGYRMALLREKAVAGVGPAQDPGPPRWTTYVSVADADTTTAAVREAGGTVLLEPMDVLDAGRMAVFSDPTGVVLSIWQPGQHRGAQLANEPGTFCWSELNSRDTETAAAFYEAVFGWKADTTTEPTQYTQFVLDGRSVAGMLDMAGRVPDEVPAHWLVYFGSADVDGTVAAAQQEGGQVFVGPMDIPAGRFAVLGDPQGAVFAVFHMPAS